MAAISQDVFAGYKVVPVTLANSDLPNGPCRSIVCGSAGTLNFMEIDGVTIRTNFPLPQGYNPIQAQQIRLGGTASDLWALY
jgi:hypothetical protein